MCLIIRKPAAARVPYGAFRNAHKHNPDGFGLMYAENGRVTAVQGLFPLEYCWWLYEQHRDKKLAIHFRYATQGLVDSLNTHPFKVLDKEQHGHDLWLMHNGTFKGLRDPARGRSDTLLFVDTILRPALEKYGPSTIFRRDVRYGLGRDLGKFNRLLFMDGYGRTYLVNKRAGFEYRNIWYSNTYSLVADSEMAWRTPRTTSPQWEDHVAEV